MYKPEISNNDYAAKGWADGCLSASNAYSPLFAPLLDKPFVHEADDAADISGQANAPADKSKTKTFPYDREWNVGYTSCRYYQAVVYELIQFIMLIATLLFVGYGLKQRNPSA